MGSDWLVFQPWKLINNYIDDYALCPTVSMKRLYLFLQECVQKCKDEIYHHHVSRFITSISMSRYYPQISTVLEVSKVMSIFPGSESLQSLIPGWSVARSLIITLW